MYLLETINVVRWNCVIAHIVLFHFCCAWIKHKYLGNDNIRSWPMWFLIYSLDKWTINNTCFNCVRDFFVMLRVWSLKLFNLSLCALAHWQEHRYLLALANKSSLHITIKQKNLSWSSLIFYLLIVRILLFCIHVTSFALLFFFTKKNTTSH